MNRPRSAPVAGWLAAPALLTIVALMLLPMLITLGYSLMTPTPYGGVTLPATFASYQRLAWDRDLDDRLTLDPTYAWIFARSALQAGTATVCCIVAGLPLAWWMATRPRRTQRWLVLIVTIPFWTNLLIRTYCWVLILRENGLLNQMLQAFGLTSGPVTFLYSDGAVLLGLVYANLPFMVLPIYAALEKVDPRVIEAAHDLYASPPRILALVVWPLAKPGIGAGTLLVFVPALGSFLAPDILGGNRSLMLGPLIQQQFSTARDWAFGSALSVNLVVVVLGVLALGARRRTPVPADRE